jgi:threonine dehydrogenase-like Zn-dependent dehydrogenase
MKTEGIWVLEPNKIGVKSFELPDEPSFNDVQIEVKACGVCAWDSSLYQGITGPGPTPYPIGHEAVGIIRKAGGGVKNLKPGDKVFVANSPDSYMMSRFINNMAEGVARIPDDVTEYHKWVIEPTCCVVNLLNRTQIQAGDSVVLVGAGYMGLLTLMGLIRGSQAGEITVFEPVEARRVLAADYGAKNIYDPYSAEGRAMIEKIAAEGGRDIVIDFSTSDDGWVIANKMVKKSGKLTIGSWHRKELAFDGSLWHLKGITVYNLSPMSNPHYSDVLPAAAQMLKNGVYTPWDLITHVADYRDCDSVFRKSISKEDGYIKGVVTFYD